MGSAGQQLNDSKKYENPLKNKKNGYILEKLWKFLKLNYLNSSYTGKHFLLPVLSYLHVEPSSLAYLYLGPWWRPCCHCYILSYYPAYNFCNNVKRPKRLMGLKLVIMSLDAEALTCWCWCIFSFVRSKILVECPSPVNYYFLVNSVFTIINVQFSF